MSAWDQYFNDIEHEKNKCKPFYVEWYAGSSGGWQTLGHFNNKRDAEAFTSKLDNWHRSSAEIRENDKCMKKK